MNKDEDQYSQNKDVPVSEQEMANNKKRACNLFIEQETRYTLHALQKYSSTWCKKIMLQKNYTSWEKCCNSSTFTLLFSACSPGKLKLVLYNGTIFASDPPLLNIFPLIFVSSVYGIL